jgi:transcriptional regulator with XRE-family HTH domain
VKSTRVGTAITTKNIVGPKIRAARLALRPTCTQDDLTGRLSNLDIKIDRSAIARIERGQRYVMDYELWAIAKCLKVNVEDLLKH